MGKWLFLLFTVVPVVEVALLVQIGGVLGAWPTVGVVVATGLIGAWLARSEGARVFRDWQAAMVQGRLPKDGVISGLLVLVGGVLLVTPGVLTDALGFALLVPLTRRPIAELVRRRAERHIADRVASGQVIVETFESASAPPPRQPLRDFAGRDTADVRGRGGSDVIDMPPS